MQENQERHGFLREVAAHPCAALCGVFLMVSGMAAGCTAGRFSNVAHGLLKADAMPLVRFALFSIIAFCLIYSALPSPFMLPASLIGMFGFSCAQGMLIYLLFTGGFISILLGVVFIIIPLIVQSSAQLMCFIHAFSSSRRKQAALSVEDAASLRKNLLLWLCGLAVLTCFCILYARCV